jgi:hypothetical protein
MSFGFFPDPNLLTVDAFRVLLESRAKGACREPFPMLISKLEGESGNFAQESARAFARLAARRRLALAGFASARTVLCLGTTEGIVALTRALESGGSRFLRSDRTLSSLTEDERRDLLREVC